MKKIKIYWRLAAILSALTAIAWGIVYLVNGEVPTWYLSKAWYDEFDWVINIFPLWMLSRWWDIVGIFLLTTVIHAILAMRLSEEKPSAKHGIRSVLIFQVLVGFGGGFMIVIGLFMLVLANALVGFIIILPSSIIAYVMISFIEYLSEKEVVKKTGNWIMQKK
jgi:hypothetical protein